MSADKCSTQPLLCRDSQVDTQGNCAPLLRGEAVYFVQSGKRRLLFDEGRLLEEEGHV